VRERFTRLAPSSDTQVESSSRVVRYKFSDESIGRDGHIVVASAWQTDNFEANPVFLWQHLDEEPPIGRVFDLHTQGRELRGAVKYAETPFADTIFGLVRDGFLNATSTSWQPIEFEPLEGYGRGLKFTKVDLLEISQVAIPALPTALAQAGRSINLRPLRDWASRALDKRSYGTLGRNEVERIYRAATPGRFSSTQRRSETAVDRAARAQAIKARVDRDQERSIYERYEALRTGYGYDAEMAARHLHMPLNELRAVIARALREKAA
jgi:hypothetical protein